MPNFFYFQDPTKPTEVDLIAAGLVRLVHALVCLGDEEVSQEALPARFVPIIF